MFGCLCFASTSTINRRKFDSRAHQCSFFGYLAGHKGYKVLDMKTRQIFISRDLVFHEQHFPFHFKKNSEYAPSLFLPVCTDQSSFHTTELPDIFQFIDITSPANSVDSPANTDVIDTNGSTSSENTTTNSISDNEVSTNNSRRSTRN